MRRLFLVVAMLAMSVIPVGTALAHTEAQDGKISGFLHIEPDDKPQAGKINTIHIYYNDQDHRFTTEGCDCKIKITQEDKVLYSGILPAAGSQKGEIKQLLPENNISYEVVVTGTPKTAGFFQPFKLNFDIDVGNPPELPVQPAHNNRNYVLAATIGAILIIGVAGFMLYRRSKNT